VSIALPRIFVDAFVPYAVLVVVLAMLFGGGARQGFWSDAFVQLAAIPLFVWALLRLTLSELCGSARWAIVLLCAILALPILQLIPLPPDIWGKLPGRAGIVSAYHVAGIALPWLPISLDSTATWMSLLSLIPAAAIFLAILSLDRRTHRILVAVLLVFAFVNGLLDLLQMLGGDQSSLRFFAITNPDRAVGLFANANHNAAFLYCSIPLTAAWFVGLHYDRHQYRSIGTIFLFLLFVIIIIGLALTESRAGLLLGFVAGFSSLALIWKRGNGHSSRRVLLIGLGVNLFALIVAFQFGFVALTNKVENADIMSDIRWPVAAVTYDAALANLPLGTGFGTFVPVFESFSPRTILRDRYVNHAHDDWLELWLTGGIPAALITAIFLAWFVRSSIRVWRRSAVDISFGDAALRRAATIVIVLLLLHSSVDYPLRTTAITVLFAIACAILIPRDSDESMRRLISPIPVAA
jgi:O-antigen ligase